MMQSPKGASGLYPASCDKQAGNALEEVRTCGILRRAICDSLATHEWSLEAVRADVCELRGT